MTTPNDFNLDQETITQTGLRLSDEAINSQVAPGARIFEYPHLDKVFVMESDLYGNTMPKRLLLPGFLWAPWINRKTFEGGNA